MKTIDRTNYVDCLAGAQQDYHRNYHAMYSSVLDGIVTDPALMLIPVDDHIVHRGDGIFETFKCTGANIYNMDAHLRRLMSSAQALYYDLPWSISEIAERVIETARAARQADCLIRVLVSRGPGSFAASPYDCREPGLYIVTSNLPTPFMARHPQGARIIVTSLPLKPPPLDTTKSCNYLLNALMKKETADAGADFCAIFDEHGFLAEGATENIGVVTPDGELLFPGPQRILQGTTMLRVMELAQALVRAGDLRSVTTRDIPRDLLNRAAEILVVATTVNVAAAREFDGAPVANGAPGPVYRKLNDLLVDDIRGNPDLLTPVLWGGNRGRI